MDEYGPTFDQTSEALQQAAKERSLQMAIDDKQAKLQRKEKMGNLGQGAGTIIGAIVGAYYGQPQLGAKMGGSLGRTGGELLGGGKEGLMEMGSGQGSSGGLDQFQSLLGDAAKKKNLQGAAKGMSIADYDNQVNYIE